LNAYRLIGAKIATVAAARLSVRAQLAAPEQAPFQRTKRMPTAGLAVSTSRAPAFQVVAQLAAQASPGWSLATDPAPAILIASLTCLSSRTSQGESRTSIHDPECP
jgi:hypothetical protein